MRANWNGHTWLLAWLGYDALSVICLDPNMQDGIDQTSWPSDREVSVRVGTPVRWFDAGDSQAGPEGIFRTHHE